MAIGEAGLGSARRGSRPKRLEAAMRDRLGRECVYVPSCRFGLFVALRHWCPPGGRVLMSPVNDDVIFFVVLAAGLRPVQAPLNPLDASIDVDAVPDEVWGSLSAVLTTNLYGNPDDTPRLRRKCDALGIPLFEDGAHAIGSEVGGRPVGAWGDASVFSLSKHVGAKAGGFLACADPGLREALTKTCEDLLLPRRPSAELAYAVRPYAEATVRGLRLRRAAWATLRLLGRMEREEIRMPLRPGELARAVDAAPDLAAHDSWVRVDMHDYRLRSGSLRMGRIGRRLERLDEVLAACRAGTELLLSTPWARPCAPRAERAQPLFRVPLFVADRDAAIAALARRGIVVGYLYDPPLDDYAGAAFTDLSPDPAGARWFARHALPVDPLRARQVVEVLQESGARPADAPGGLEPSRG
ncbi:DegT/DnrJ/EryC1/StrS family aminotransferase [Streptomyces sp. NBC_01275]|uniref:DegT/DnrJ/EryC1/StrS family aminotransferase n=1 Tax=Streptomyces sp. NBC_01275 TaxID=2903807 RepID=UPI00225789BE|nr:DegT/DnrJ/EryC1/StrS family aminotransferase [Streptomyces sp. NBC_01275]MCX4764229.1 DegT/DnrJ/EryC1/StrS family aminotransferase [Streptomyces sp. NBC_01275]